MPPKPKYTRDEIINVAFKMVRKNGIQSLVARELGKELGTSSSPIFTAFKNMEELQQEVRKMAMKEFEANVHDAVNHSPAFKEFGIKMIQFSIEEPKLFQLLYMQEHDKSQTYSDMVKELGNTVEICLEFIQNDYGLFREQAELLFRQVWLYTFGICVLLAGKVCSFTKEEISSMLTMEFQSTLMLIKEEN